jgi:hypothetical protein
MPTFSWSILSPSPSGPSATGPSPLAVSTEIDLDDGGPATVVIHWGDGKTSTIDFGDGDFDATANHAYSMPGTYHATSEGGNPDTLTFIALGLHPHPSPGRVSFVRR